MSKDSFGRNIEYLRISVTDRCNLRCTYCMPEEGVKKQPHGAMLTLEEIARFVEVISSRGIKHIRLTGGEPLVRLGIVDLVKELKQIPTIDSVAMTTNGVLLPKMASDLKEAGLGRVNISLDTLDEKQFHEITRVGHLEDTLAGIDAALEYNLSPVKINTVVVRSLKQNFASFAEMTIKKPLHVRFIEFMPIGDSFEGTGIGWTQEDTIPNSELVEIINNETVEAGLGKLRELKVEEGPEGWGPASYYCLENSKGTIGFISALSKHFCAQCNRMRLTSDGKLRPCLFSDEEFDVKEAIRSHDNEEILRIFDLALSKKPIEYDQRIGTFRKMSQIGG